MVQVKHVQGGNVPGGHHIIWDGEKKFLAPMTECDSIPLRHSDIVVDIGAHVGTYAIRCARFPVKQVIAYEASPATYNVLTMTKLPNLKPILSAIVGDDRPTVNLYLAKGIGMTNSIVASRYKAGKVTVPAVRYETAVAEATIIKIDVEGAEYLYNINFIQPHLRALLVDFHPVTHHNWIANARAIIQMIHAAGFKPVILPTFQNGWSRAGSWVRDVPETEDGYLPMLRGQECCGCGKPIQATSKALCPTCWAMWLPRHREGYQEAV